MNDKAALRALTDEELLSELSRLSDGTEDATAAVQEAMDRGLRELPPGSYRITVPIALR